MHRKKSQQTQKIISPLNLNSFLAFNYSLPWWPFPPDIFLYFISDFKEEEEEEKQEELPM